MRFPKGNTALNCCWQVRASHHPQQPLSCGRFGPEEEEAAQKDPFQAEKKTGLGYSKETEGGGHWG